MSTLGGTADEFELLVGDLKTIRDRGPRAVGSCPRLLTAVGLPTDLSPELAWNAVEQRLKSLAAQLEPKLREPFIQGMRLRQSVPLDYGKRLELIAAHQDRSTRTARRRVDDAIDVVAQIMVADNTKSPVPTPDWLMVRGSVHADLRRDSPTLVMTRTIMALVPVVDRFDEKMSVPGMEPTESIRATALEGCTVEGVETLGSGSFRVLTGLSQAVTYGAEHTFTISVELPRHEVMAPMVGFYPLNPTQEIRASVSFGPRRPVSIARFEGDIPVGTFPPITEELDPNQRHHECVFRDVQVGCGYGIKWFWD